MDDQREPISEERRRQAYRNAASNLLAFGHEADPGHRVQSPTSGAWHPCHCSGDADHVGALVPGDPVSATMAVLSARGVELPDDPVLLVVPEGWFDLSGDPTVMSWPPTADDWPDA